jgi:fatty-acyl-CoA synthase
VEELTEFLRKQLAAHKTPVYWSFTDELPMTPTGKIQKFVLRDRVAGGDLTFDAVRPAAERAVSDAP